MKISHNWLKDYIKFNLAPAQLAERLSMLGLEVGSYEDLAEKYEKFIVGEVVEKEKHPNADRLVVCKVSVGKEVLTIVCGAPNVAAGQKVIVALAGAVIPHNQHDPDGKPFTLERAKLRGVESNGMICSAYEVGLGGDMDGIVVLDGKAKAGTPLAKYLQATDVIYEMEITANRGDWLSHIGVAREIQAVTNVKASLPKIEIRESKAPASKHATIKILDKNKCRRYSSRIVRGVKVGHSPQWLQDRLRAVGLRPINNVVDVTNYVMLETGQPIHAFDYDLLAKQTIIVKCASDGEKFTTLDGKERVLNSNILMICDGNRPVAIAGVMGGANSEISDQTSNILIESANFDSSSTRRAARFVGLSTDASQRFERGVDIEMTAYAANRVAQLLQELTGAEVLKGLLDVYPMKEKRRTVKLRVERTNAVLGTALSKQQVVSLLKRIELKVIAQSKDSVTFAIPTFRSDLIEEIDLIEEVARVYGYDNIETKTRTTVDFSKPLQMVTLQDELRNYCVGAGFNEMETFSLVDKQSGHLGGDKPVEMLNPVSVEASVLRTSLIPGALQSVRHNKSYGQKDLRLFEIGNVFSLKDEQIKESLEGFNEEERLLLLLTGRITAPGYGTEGRNVDLFDLKGEVEALFAKFRLDKYSFISYDNAGALIQSALAVEINGTYAGSLGKITKSVAENFDIEEEVLVCELKTGVFSEYWTRDKKFKELPRFPSVRRDLAFIVEVNLPQEKVEQAIREAGQPLISELMLFDVYIGERIGAGKKSMAYSLELQPYDRTLTDKEADDLVGKIVAHVQAKCNATLRSQ